MRWLLAALAVALVAGCGSTTTKTVIRPIPSAPLPPQQQCAPTNPKATGCTPEGPKGLPKGVAHISSVSPGPTIDTRGLHLIEFFEGYSRCAYWDPYGGVWTAGFGQTQGIYGGFCFAGRGAAEANLAGSVRRGYEWAVHEACGRACGQHQVNALDSFAYNLGPYIFRLSGSLRADIRAGRFSAACGIMLGYVHAGGVVLAGLVTRRRLECAELLRPSAPCNSACLAKRRHAAKLVLLHRLYHQRAGLRARVHKHRCRVVHGRRAYRKCPALGRGLRRAERRIRALHRERIF